LRSGYPDLVAAGPASSLGATVLIAECTWEPGSRAIARAIRRDVSTPGVHPSPQAARRLSRWALRALDGDRVHYAVLSEAERPGFAATWGVDPSRVHATLFRATAADVSGAGNPEQAADVTVPLDRCSGVFAGGDNLRDYRPLLAAAPSIGARVTVATRLDLGGIAGAAEAGPVAPDVYAQRAAGAAVVVVPLVSDSVRSAGQQTFLNAMYHGKPVVVTDTVGVREYIDDGVTGVLVPPGDPVALAAAVNRLLDHPDDAAAIGQRARAAVLERFLPEHYYARLIELARNLGHG
jgi:glycosyltransferase involved in cell wall biosynthesis